MSITPLVQTSAFAEATERLFAKLKNDLGGRYEILPVNARTVLSMDGGVHCVFGIIREIDIPSAGAAARN